MEINILLILLGLETFFILNYYIMIIVEGVKKKKIVRMENVYLRHKLCRHRQNDTKHSILSN